MASTFLILLILLAILEIYFEVNYTKITEIRFKTNKLPQGTSFKILQISDVHGRNPQNKSDFLRQAKLAQPNVIVITGDLIDRYTTDFITVYSFVEELINITQWIYYVSGNHEWDNKRSEAFLQGLKKLNVVILNNKNTYVNFRKTSINICGVDDYHTGHADLELATQGINDKLYTILLSHSPGIIEEKYLTADLVISGHTHGGQVRFPLIGGIVAPGQGLFPKFQKGIYNLGSGKSLYIDSGLGTSSLPIRLLNRSQVSLITIVGAVQMGGSQTSFAIIPTIPPNIFFESKCAFS